MHRAASLWSAVLLLLLIPSPVSSQTTTQPATIDKVASGIGRTESDAVKNALTNAIQQVVGAMCEAETLVANDAVVRDQVLTYSAGIVEHYDLIGEVRSAGDSLMAVTIRATVKKDALIARLRSANVAVTSVDGQGMFAEVVTRRQQRQDAAEMLAPEFRDVPRSFVRADVVGKAAYDEEKHKVVVPVRVWIDADAYDSFVQRLTRKLEQMNLASVDLQAAKHRRGLGRPGIFQVQFPTPLTDSMVEQDQEPRRGNQPSGAIGRANAAKEQRALLLVCIKADPKFTSSRWRLYFVPQEAAEAITAVIAPVSISVDLKDDAGKTIDVHQWAIGEKHRITAGDKLVLSNCPVANLSLWYWKEGGSEISIFVGPIVQGSALLMGSQTMQFDPKAAPEYEQRVSFNLNLDDLPRISRIECRVE